ncbi:MAG: RNA polymerase sigma factor [Planctomycetes bacterium]|nr:RNA polymerase sigma factor [Planctomycetota bacterium]
MTPEIPDEVLRRARLGDRAAFRALAEALLKYTFNLSYRMTYNAADAEDLTQEILLRLFQNLGRYDAAQPFLPWFRRVATNCALNWKERLANRRTAPLDPELAPGVEGASPSDPSERLRQAVQDLPAEYQTCLALRYLENLGVAEIASTMKVPVGTVKTWLFRAREALKERLKPHMERIV